MDSQNRVANLSDFRRESAEQLSRLIDDLNEHNRHHGPGANMGKMLGRFLSARIEGQDPDMNRAQAEVIVESAQDARTGLAELQTKHRAVLNRFGLSLAHEASIGLRHGLPSGPISMKVTDVRAFLRYAQSVKPILTSEGRNGPFKTLLESVEQQIRTIDFEHPSPIDRSILENLDDEAEAFGRIDPDLDLRTLKQYALFQQTKRLPNYLAVEHAGLWHNPGKGFGPADWIKDMMPAELDRRWAHAAETLRSQQKLEKTGVAQELKSHLLLCIEKAIENLSEIQWSKDYDYKEDFSKILEKYRGEINSIGN